MPGERNQKSAFSEKTLFYIGGTREEGGRGGASEENQLYSIKPFRRRHGEKDRRNAKRKIS